MAQTQSDDAMHKQDETQCRHTMMVYTQGDGATQTQGDGATQTQGNDSGATKQHKHKATAQLKHEVMMMMQHNTQKVMDSIVGGLYGSFVVPFFFKFQK